MKPELARLNFFELLHYDGKPWVQHKYDPPLQCRGYCVHCEESGNVFDKTGDNFDQISHGCSTSDYEEVLGPLPNRPKNPRIDSPILFLLENPAGSWACTVGFGGYKKKIPTTHYYWTPDICQWPDNADNLDWSENYGNYLSYLMNKHQLHNVYITNLIKCNTDIKTKYNYDESRSNCIENYLKKEIEMFSPEFVFSFGYKADKGFRIYSREYNRNIPSLCLLHPAQYKYPKNEMLSTNDSNIRRFLGKSL